MDRPNLLIHLLPQFSEWQSVIRVVDYSQDNLTLFSDIVSQQIICIQEDSPPAISDPKPGPEACEGKQGECIK
jgi:hypothetical protein